MKLFITNHQPIKKCPHCNSLNIKEDIIQNNHKQKYVPIKCWSARACAITFFIASLLMFLGFLYNIILCRYNSSTIIDFSNVWLTLIFLFLGAVAAIITKRLEEDPYLCVVCSDCQKITPLKRVK